MYSKFQLARKYARYLLTASNGKGHGIHSPFVYDFVKNVLNDKQDYAAYTRVETLRRQLLKDPAILEIEDLGAGSAAGGSSAAQDSGPASRIMHRRSVAELARHAAKPPRLGQLLFRIARYYQSGIILELGTSLGLSTAYFALAREQAKVLTIEGAGAIAAVAEKNFRSLDLRNVEWTVGNFDDVLADALDRGGSPDLVFVDGNHRLEPTLYYFDWLIHRSSPSSILIFDDIHWSGEMEEAWKTIREDPRVMLTIDLFFIGIVVQRENFKIKQDFTIRF